MTVSKIKYAGLVVPTHVHTHSMREPGQAGADPRGAWGEMKKHAFSAPIDAVCRTLGTASRRSYPTKV
jgi:hypothetical protein